MIRKVKINDLIALRNKLSDIISKYDPNSKIDVDMDYMLLNVIEIPKVNFDNMTVEEIWQFFWHKDPPKDAHFEYDRKYIVWTRDDNQTASILVCTLIDDFYSHPELFDKNGRIK